MTEPLVTPQRVIEEGDAALLFESVVDTLHERLALINQAYTIIAVNTIALPPGKKKEQVIGKELFSTYPNLVSQGFRDIIARVFETGVEYSQRSVEHRTVDGFFGYHHRRVVPITRNGTVVYVAIFVENVHEEKTALVAAEQAQMQYKELIETLRLFSFELDSTGKFLYVNNAVGPLFGYAPGEMIGQSISRYILDDEVGRLWQVFWQIVNQGNPNGVCENKFRGADGRIVHMRCNIHPVYDVGGKIVGCRGVAEDITSSAERLHALEEARGLFQQAFQVAPVPLMVLHGDSIDAMNRAAHRLCNVTHDHAKGKPFLDLFIEDDQFEVRARMRDAERDGKSDCRARMGKSGRPLILCGLAFMRVSRGLVVALNAKNP